MPTARRRLCGGCPWLRDAPPGHFPAEAFRRLAPTTYEMWFIRGRRE